MRRRRAQLPANRGVPLAKNAPQPFSDGLPPPRAQRRHGLFGVTGVGAGAENMVFDARGRTQALLVARASPTGSYELRRQQAAGWRRRSFATWARASCRCPPARLDMAAAARLHGAQRRSLPAEPARKPQTALVVREQYSLGLQPVQSSVHFAELGHVRVSAVCGLCGSFASVAAHVHMYMCVQSMCLAPSVVRFT